MTVEAITLFKTELYKTKFKGHDVVKNYLMSHIYPKFLEDGPNDSVQNIYTDYYPGAKQCHWNLFIKHYESACKEILEKIDINFKDPWKIIIKPWYNFTTYNDKEFLHDHVGGPSTIQFSAVHFVVFDNNCQGTVFENPSYQYIKSIAPTKNVDHLPLYFREHKRIPIVEEGDFILFPSWLRHHVPPHTSNTLRITVAMNIILRIDNSDGM